MLLLFILSSPDLAAIELLNCTAAAADCLTDAALLRLGELLSRQPGARKRALRLRLETALAAGETAEALPVTLRGVQARPGCHPPVRPPARRGCQPATGPAARL